MSTFTQAPRPGRRGFLPVFAAVMLIASIVVAFAMAPVGDEVVRAFAVGRPHLPDLEVWTRLSVPIQIHLVTALAALVLGGVLMVVRKGRTFHRLGGWAWVALVAVTAGATLFIKVLNPGSWSLLHLLTAWTLFILPLGVLAAKRHTIVQHRARMMGLFYGGFAINVLIAFLPGRALWVMVFG